MFSKRFLEGLLHKRTDGNCQQTLLLQCPCDTEHLTLSGAWHGHTHPTLAHLDNICALGAENARFHVGINLSLGKAEGRELGGRRELDLDGRHAGRESIQDSRLPSCRWRVRGVSANDRGVS
jgi:hypothetical protein